MLWREGGEDTRVYKGKEVMGIDMMKGHIIEMEKEYGRMERRRYKTERDKGKEERG
jgi:hypothetical protein